MYTDNCERDATSPGYVGGIKKEIGLLAPGSLEKKLCRAKTSVSQDRVLVDWSNVSEGVMLWLVLRKIKSDEKESMVAAGLK